MFKDTFTYFRQATSTQIRQLYSKLNITPCLLCGIPSPDDNLCFDCLDLLPRLPQVCQRCALPIPQGEICGQCLSKPPTQQRTISLFSYTQPLDKLISDMKYHHNLAILQTLSVQLAEHIKQYQPEIDLLIPIPLHLSRLRQRGFNQATEIAKILSKRLNIPMDSATLIRTKKTQAQTQLPYKQRKKNMQGAFDTQINPFPKRIALIDDVLTTGHTAEIAAKACLKNGAEIVEIWTIARTIRHHAHYG